MNRAHIREVAESIWNNVVTVDENIIRGELKINSDHNAGICFLDMRDEIRLDDFNDYQEKLLADEYYNNPGPIQWNFYLFLLRDNVDSLTKQTIEKDDKYARKYVFKEHEFEDFFKLETSTAQITGSIVLEWKKKLDSVDLHEVYTNVGYTTGVENFVKNKTPKTRVNLPSTTIYSQTHLNFIDRIQLHNTYREYPKTRHYNFGKVNLVKGINGVGKTSLFEAIELIACGKTYRNSKKIEPDNCIEANINGNMISTEICKPSKSEKYRARDLFWYSNEYNRDNLTAESFNRFNFFNSDAANDFVNSNSEDEIKKALSNLVLGPEYSFILEKMAGYTDRIRPIYNQLKKAIEDNSKKIKEADETIERFKKSGSMQGLKVLIQEDMGKLQFLKKDLKIDDNTVNVDIVVNQLKTLLEILFRDSLKVVQSYADLTIQKSVLQAKRDKFTDFKQKVDDLNLTITAKEKDLVACTNRQMVLSNALKYFNDIRAFSIKGLGARITSNNEALKRLKVVKNTIGSSNLQQYSLPQTLNFFYDENLLQLTTAREELAKINASISESMHKLDKIGQIVAQIRALGKEYISIDTNAHTCPLCQTDFERNRLVAEINNEIASYSDENTQTGNLITAQGSWKDKIELCQQHQIHINVIRSSYAVISDNVPDDLPLETLVLAIQTTLSEEDRLLYTKTELDGFEQWATSFGLSEQEFSYLEWEIKALGETTIVFTSDKKNAFLTAKQKVESVMEGLQKEINDLTELKKRLNLQVKTDLDLLPDKEYKPSEIISIFTVEEQRLALYEDTFRKIREIITLDDHGSLEDVNSQLSLLEKNLKTIKTELQNQFALQNAEKEKANAEIFISNNQANFERIEKGYETLKRLSENKETDQLSSFFDQNFKEVNDIFHTLHSPREFKSLQFKEKQLYLIRENDQERKISEISTGQRAALAISLFISLNRKLKNGPNIILFDDPVSHIDDLNALSFLDFLRFFILKENKQIFIATANARLATLIEKKFHFLGDDFKQWELTR
jgi:recombinational DNA repair ATPase RecF